MSQETTIYLVNLIIGTILAVLMTQHWRRDSQAHGLRYWTIAAWTLAVADLFFAMRPLMPYALGRFLPTLMVTVGHGALLLAAERTAERAMRWNTVWIICLVHAIALAIFLSVGADSEWRTVVNGLTWGGLSIMTARALWRGPANIRQAFLIPAGVFVWQALFHAARTLAATGGAVNTGEGSSSLVQLLGDLEVSLFMVALFVSVLSAHLRDANAQLRAALGDVRQLSALLRICAWCRKVRTDDGHWKQLEQYLVERRIDVTHAICGSCAEQIERGVIPAVGPDPAKRIAP